MYIIVFEVKFRDMKKIEIIDIIFGKGGSSSSNSYF